MRRKFHPCINHRVNKSHATMLPHSYHVYQWLTILVVLMPTTHISRFAVANEASDTFYIRHERSKVRHSNEKDHILWAMHSPQPQKHNESSLGYDTSTATMHDNVTSSVFRGGGGGASGIVATSSRISSIPNGNGHLFGTDYWMQSNVNGSLVKQVIIEEPPTPPSALNHRTAPTEVVPTPHAGATIMPVTHKIRKLHKKQIMESIRMSSSDKGRLAKNHRSLAEAEQIAGRQVPSRDAHDDEEVVPPPQPTPVPRELDEVLQLADELDMDNSLEQTSDDVLADYLNDVEQHSEVTTMKPRDDIGGSSKQSQMFANDTISSPLSGNQRNRDFVTAVARPPKEPPESATDGKHSAEQSTERDYSAPLDEDMNSAIENDSLSVGLIETTTVQWVDSAEAQSLGPNQLASTSVGGIAADRQQQSMEFDQIKFDDNAGEDEGTMDDAFVIESKASGFPVSLGGGGGAGGVGEDSEETDSHTDSSSIMGTADNDDEINPFLAGVVDGANEDEIYDWDEISRDNRRNLMRGRDVVTKFLQIVETQHLLGSNCEAGTSLYLGDGVVDRYAQDRFRVEAEVAVNRANMLTRIFKMTAPAVQADVNLLHASVLSMVEFDDDIFAAGNCFDWNEHPSQAGLFCPFAYRLPPPHLGAIFAKDLATEYHYLGNTSEWFFQARKNAEKVIAHNEQYLKAFHLFSNKTDERIEDDTLAVKYEDGRWSKPYYDCGGGNIWMLTYTVPFFGYENGTYHFKGTSGIDIDLRRVDIDQCPQRNTPGTTQPLNIFAGTDKCKQRTTMCEALKGLGFRRGSYKCVCRKGYYFPDTKSTQKFFNGSLLEEEYEKLMLGNNSTYNIVNEYECLPCAEGCDSCEDSSPCIAALNWPMRTSILVLACTVIGLLPPAAWFTFRYQQVKVVRAASPALLRVIALGAFFIYCTNIVMYPNPNLYTCTARIWLREIGFSLTYGALMLKTWRISVIFRVRSAKAVKITDAALLKRLGIICGVIGTCLLVRTLVSPPDVVVGRTADDLKAFLCKTDWWDYTFTSMEVFFLAWGVRLCIMVRKAPSEFNESRFISMAIYNEFLLTCFLNVSMIFLQSPANPDLLYIIFFCHTQLTVTLLLALIFGSKVYIVLRSGKSHQESIGMSAKASGAKFNFRPQVRTFANPSSITTSTVPMAGTTSAENKLSDQEALEEIRQLSMQLQRIQEMAPPKGVAVMTISSLLDGLKTPGGMMMVAAAASQAIAAPHPTTTTGNQLTVRHPAAPHGALPLLAINNEMHMYTQHQQQQQQQNNNKPIGERVERSDKSVNTDNSGGHLICSRCLEESTRQLHYSAASMRCQQLGSPPPEGSISFSNIKLECMCSQPVLDVDTEPNARRTSPTPCHAQRRLMVRTAATNTPTGKRRNSKTKKTGADHDDDQPHDVVSYQICDKCKKKYGREIDKMPKEVSAKLRAAKTKGKHIGKRLKNNETLADTKKKNAALTCSSELLKASSTTAEKRTHSSDDIIFYTTTTTSTTSSSDEHSESDASDDQSHCSVTSNNANDASRLPIDGSSAESSSKNDDVKHTKNVGSPTRPKSDTEGLNKMDSTQPSTSGSATNKSNGNGDRPKRPDKLVLDLNDRSKYTKEVSV